MLNYRRVFTTCFIHRGCPAKPKKCSSRCLVICCKLVPSETHSDDPKKTIPLYTSSQDIPEKIPVYHYYPKHIYIVYPLVNVYITMEHHHFLAGTSHYTWAMFNRFLYVYQAGYTTPVRTEEQPQNSLIKATPWWSCVRRAADEAMVVVTIDEATMWGPPVISWFISPSNYSYKYHKPQLLEL